MNTNKGTLNWLSNSTNTNLKLSRKIATIDTLNNINELDSDINIDNIIFPNQDLFPTFYQDREDNIAFFEDEMVKNKIVEKNMIQGNYLGISDLNIPQLTELEGEIIPEFTPKC